MATLTTSSPVPTSYPGGGWAYNQRSPDVPNKGPNIAIIGGVFTGVAFIFLTLRLYVRLLMIKSSGIDDWTILLTWLLSLGFTVVSTLQTKWGMGLRLEDFPPENAIPFGKLQYVGAPFYILGILGFKLALLFSYIRIASERNYVRVVKFITVLCIGFHLSFLFTQLFLCSPVSFQWDQASQTGKCLDGPTVYYTMASLTMVFDITVILTPIPLLLGSRIQRRKKIVLIGLFTLGFFITICQLVRIFTIKNLKNLIDSSGIIMWSMVELNLAIIIACIPTLSPLFRYYRERTYGSGNGQSNGYNSGHGTAAKRLTTVAGGSSAFDGSGRNGGKPKVRLPDNDRDVFPLTNLSNRHGTRVTITGRGLRSDSGEDIEKRATEESHNGSEEMIIGKATGKFSSDCERDEELEEVRNVHARGRDYGQDNGGIRAHTEVSVTVERDRQL